MQKPWQPSARSRGSSQAGPTKDTIHHAHNTQHIAWLAWLLLRAGIVHRDIKPQNCIVSDDDKKIKLIDLGGAADLRVGINYAPKEYLLDPRLVVHTHTHTRARARCHVCRETPQAHPLRHHRRLHPPQLCVRACVCVSLCVCVDTPHPSSTL